MTEMKQWKHIFKLDPNKEISDEALEKICESGTDAIIVGGTDGVTMENVLSLLVRIRRYYVPVALEVSTVEAVTPGFDYYFIPTVLNSGKSEWIVGMQQKALREFGDIINWDEIAVEGYCILNKNAKAAVLTEAVCEVDVDDVIAYAQMAEHFFHLPIFYLEYSGMYGDVEIVKQVKKVLKTTQLFYGGGITTEEQAKEMATHADTIIIGNIIYDDLKAALRTVRATK